MLEAPVNRPTKGYLSVNIAKRFSPKTLVDMLLPNQILSVGTENSWVSAKDKGLKVWKHHHTLRNQTSTYSFQTHRGTSS